MAQKQESERVLLLRVLDRLNQDLPCAYHVKLRLLDLAKEFGYADERETTRDGKHFLITVCKGLEPRQAIETLEHEYAHCLAWFSSPEDHGPEWGVAYSRIYSLIHES